MLTIYTYWDSSEHAPKHQAELIRLWEHSWRARGWTPRILTVRNAQKHKLFKQSHPIDYPRLAFEANRRKGRLVDVTEINFGHTPRVRGGFEIIRFLSAGWETAPV